MAQIFVFMMAAWGHLAYAGPQYRDVNDCRVIVPGLGGGLSPSCRTRWKRFYGDALIFDAEISTDQFGRRKTPPSKSQGPYIGNTIFFGCSFTLGAGVEDSETLPAHYASLKPQRRVYNYGGSGFGPQQMLVYLSRKHLTNQIDNPALQTLGIYVFLDFHLQRASGKPSVVNHFGKYFPYYTLDEKGGVVYHESFESAYPFWFSLYEIAGKIRFLENLFERSMESVTEKDVQLTSRLIAVARLKFLERLEGGKFLVLIYPGSLAEPTARVKAELEREKITYLDYSSGWSDVGPADYLPDGHPSGLVHESVAKRLAADLMKNP